MRAANLGCFLLIAPDRKHRQHGRGGAQPYVDAYELPERMQRERRVDRRRYDDRNPWRAVPRMFAAEEWREVAVIGHRKGHARSR